MSKTKTYKKCTLSRGLKLNAFDGWSIDDIKDTSDSNKKFLKNHGIIFGDPNIISKEDNLDIEQDILNSVMSLLEMAHDNMSPEDYKKFASQLKQHRQTYAKKFSVLFKYIKKLHKASNIVDKLEDE